MLWRGLNLPQTADRSGAAFQCLAAALLAGCTNAPLPKIADDLAKTANTAIAALPKPDLALPTNTYNPPVGTPTTIYTRVARGALTCWFGGHGPLKKTHRFHAQADPPQQGGRSHITIYEIPKDKARKLGDRAFVIQITPDGASAKVETKNTRLPKSQATKFAKDVARWAANEEGCLKAEEIAKDWSPTATAGNKKQSTKARK